MNESYYSQRNTKLWHGPQTSVLVAEHLEVTCSTNFRNIPGSKFPVRYDHIINLCVELRPLLHVTNLQLCIVF